MRNQTSISVSAIRGAQLRELARLRGTSVADLIGRWIVNEYEAMGADPEYAPCVTSFVTDERGASIRVEFFGGEHELTLTAAEAASLAGSLRSVLGDTDAMLNLDCRGAVVQRRGAGVQLIVNGWVKTMARDVAAEIATELAEAAAEAPHA